MGADSKIEWTHHTFNPWIGCTKVSDGCKFCYAEALMDKRWGKVKWGPNGTRQRTSDANWREPYKWDKAAAKAGERHRVFYASLADVFEDRPELVPWRRELFHMICRTPNLDWLLLTKRPENALRMMVEAGLYAAENPALPCPQPNIWVGTSVESSDVVEARVLALMKVPASIRFLSMEPLLGPVDLTFLGPERWDVTRGWKASAHNERGWANTSRIDWIIVGGESGRESRPFNVQWARDIVRQCRAAELPVFIKQLGAKVFIPEQGCAWPGTVIVPHCLGDDDYPGYLVKLKDSKGGDTDEFPADLRVRQFPKARVAP